MLWLPPIPSSKTINCYCLEVWMLSSSTASWVIYWQRAGSYRQLSLSISCCSYLPFSFPSFPLIHLPLSFPRSPHSSFTQLSSLHLTLFSSRVSRSILLYPSLPSSSLPPFLSLSFIVLTLQKLWHTHTLCSLSSYSSQPLDSFISHFARASDSYIRQDRVLYLMTVPVTYRERAKRSKRQSVEVSRD